MSSGVSLFMAPDLFPELYFSLGIEGTSSTDLSNVLKAQKASLSSYASAPTNMHFEHKNSFISSIRKAYVCIE